MQLPHLPARFYAERPQLEHILQAARSRQSPPDLVLAAVLCRVACLIPVTSTVNRSPVNYIAALVAGSGGGKSTSMETARDLIHEIGTDLDCLPVNSGEGMIDQYLTIDNGEKVLKHTAGLFYVDEGEALLNVAKRQGNITLEMLRTLWTGHLAGTSGASKDTTRRLPAGRYRFTLVVGLQPDYATQLLDGAHAGTPQRFLYLANGDPDAPSTPPAWPGELKLAHTISTAIELDPEVLNIVREARLRTLRSGTSDERRTHETLLTLRTAAILSALSGTPGRLSLDDWTLALELVEHSYNVQQTLIDHREATHLERTQQRAVNDAAYDEARALERLLHWAKGHLANGAMTGKELKDLCHSRDNQRLRHALTAGLERGELELHGSTYSLRNSP